ncbi:MAG: hypothetical protein QNJ78_14045 [Gammaproteobacteria bacterium]|nr:hypothetical protein [Gammaproteobacteria bacterium]
MDDRNLRVVGNPRGSCDEITPKRLPAHGSMHGISMRDARLPNSRKSRTPEPTYSILGKPSCQPCVIDKQAVCVALLGLR